MRNCKDLIPSIAVSTKEKRVTVAQNPHLEKPHTQKANPKEKKRKVKLAKYSMARNPSRPFLPAQGYGLFKVMNDA